MNLSVPDWLHGLPSDFAGYASIAGIAIAALIVFRVARRIVQLGYFVLYFAIGFGIVYTASAYSTRSLTVPMTMPIVGGLAFAAVAIAMRAKLMRIVSVLMIVALFSLGGKFWSEYTQSHRPGAEKSVEESHRRMAMAGLSEAKKNFDLIAKALPKEDGKLKGGHLSEDQLKKLGIDVDLSEVVQRATWHTWLTGLYEEEKVDQDLWIPSGDPAWAKQHLKIAPMAIKD